MIVATTTDARAAWAMKIKKTVAKGVLGVIQIGTDLAQAQRELSRKEFWAMVETDLQFGEKTVRRYLKIAECEWIRTHVSSLPPAMSTLAEIAYLNDDLREQGLRKGTINPNMEREDVTAIKQGACPAPKPKPRPEPREAEWTETPAPQMAKHASPAKTPIERPPLTPTQTARRWDALDAVEQALDAFMRSIDDIDMADVSRASNPTALAKIKRHLPGLRKAISEIERAAAKSEENDRTDAEETAAQRQ